MDHDTITLPAYWASALVNGDYSGLEEPGEIARCKARVAELARDGWHVVTCDEEPRFTWHYRLYDPDAECAGGEVLDYVILRAE